MRGPRPSRDPHAGPAITIFEGETITYGEMWARVASLAGGLAEHGVGRGDVVALLSYNCPEFLETIFAANYLGAIAMPINWRLAAAEVRYILEHSGAKAIVCDEALTSLADEATPGCRLARKLASANAARRLDAAESTRRTHASRARRRGRGDDVVIASCTRRERPGGPRA